MLVSEWAAMSIMKMVKFSKIMITKKFSKSEKNWESSIMMKRPIMETSKLIIDQWLSLKTMLDTTESGLLAKM